MKRTAITFNKQRGIHIAQLYVGGKRIRKKLGTAAEFVGMTPQERALVLADRLKELRLDLGLQEESTLVTLTNAVKRFLTHCTTRNSPRTVYTYGDSLKRWQQANGNPCVQDYQRGQLDNYIAQERNRGLNDRTINHHIRNVQRFFNWAYEEELVDRPFKLKQLRAVSVIPQTWSREELELMGEDIERKLTETNSRRFIVLRRAFFLFRYTGMRASELIHLRWDHILHQSIWLESDKDWQTKGKADAILPIAKPLQQFLDEEAHDSEVYVCDDGNGGKFWRDYSSAGHSFQKMLDQLGLKGPKVLHGFRATVATELLAAGESPVLVQKLLRHQQLTTTLGYLNSQTVEVQNLVNKL